MDAAGKMWYADGSWRKLKSFEGMSSMPREEPSWGDRARRAGERTRVGRGDGERFEGVSVDRGLDYSISMEVVRHAFIVATYSSPSASRGPRVNCLVRGATAAFSQLQHENVTPGADYLSVCHRRSRARDHDYSAPVRYSMAELASSVVCVQPCRAHVIGGSRPKSGFPTFTMPDITLAPPATSAKGAREW